MVACIVMFVLIQTTTQMNIGIHYLLPVYPLVMILIGRCAVTPKIRLAAVSAMTATILGSLWAMPQFHSFNNIAVQPFHRYVPDRNSGQSLIALHAWMTSHQQQRICLLYFGTADPAAYGIEATDPFSTPADTPYIALTSLLLDGVPMRIQQGFTLLRAWKQAQKIAPVAELDGLLVYRTADLLADAPEPWVVRVSSWEQARKDPLMKPIENYEERLKLEP